MGNAHGNAVGKIGRCYMAWANMTKTRPQAHRTATGAGGSAVGPAQPVYGAADLIHGALRERFVVVFGSSQK
jgi:hypothetical protein